MNTGAPQVTQNKQHRSIPILLVCLCLTITTVAAPTVNWNTFLGGGGSDIGTGVAIDANGNIYLTGSSTTAWGSPVNAFVGGVADAFVAKLDPNGNLIWSTFLGGAGEDRGIGLALDGLGNIYIAGYSTVTWGSPILPYASKRDAFVAKLDGNGNLIWNTFLGGGQNDRANALVFDGLAFLYAAGDSSASWGSPVRPFATGINSYIAKLDLNGNLIWNTFLGGSGNDEAFGLAIDAGSNLYVDGLSFGTWGSPVNGFSGTQDVFAARVDSNGNLIWNTFLGGDIGLSATTDSTGNLYLAGFSSATWGTPIVAFSGGASDGFLAKLDASGNLLWNTFLGGAGDDQTTGVAVASTGEVFASGFSNMSWGSPVDAFNAANDGFVARFDGNGSRIANTFVGGSGDDFASRFLELDGMDNIYLSGNSTASWGSPVRPFTVGSQDAFVAKLSAPTASPYVATVQQPINADGSSIFNANRGVIPIKFSLSNNGQRTCTLPTAKIMLTRTAGGTPGPINESVYSMPADSDSNFKINGCQYVYNLSSGALGAGTYRVDIKIDNQVVGSATFQLK